MQMPGMFGAQNEHAMEVAGTGTVRRQKADDSNFLPSIYLLVSDFQPSTPNSEIPGNDRPSKLAALWKTIEVPISTASQRPPF